MTLSLPVSGDDEVGEGGIKSDDQSVSGRVKVTYYFDVIFGVYRNCVPFVYSRGVYRQEED